MPIVRINSEFLVNSITTNSQSDSSVAVLADGRFVVSWTDGSLLGGDTSGNAIRARIFNPDGSQAVPEFLVNATTAGAQIASRITALSDGRFAVSWTDASAAAGDTSANAIRARIFNADGTQSVPEFVVNTTTANGQFQSSIVALSNGRIAITWTDDSASPDDTSFGAVRARIFNMDGTQAAAEFRVNATTIGDQVDSATAALPGGRFVVAWTDNSLSGGDTSSAAIRARIFNADGTQAAAEFLVNTTTSGAQTVPSVDALADGRFMVTWTDSSVSGGDTSVDAIRARIFNADGTQAAAEFLVNTTTASFQGSSRVTALADGRFVVSWTDFSASGGDTSAAAIRARIFNADGTQSIPEFLVNTTTANAQLESRVEAMADGRFVVTWTDSSVSGGDTSGAAIRSQIFDPRTFDGTAAGDSVTGGSLADVLNGLGGADNLRGFGGDDYLNGGEGIDTLEGGDGADRLDGGNGTDTLLGGTGNDILWGRAGQDNMDGGAGNDTLEGGGDIDIIYGGAGFDLAVYSGNRANYAFTTGIVAATGTPVTVISDLRSGTPDGLDGFSSVEELRFADVTIAGRASFDFNTNFTSDLLLRSQSGGDVSYWSLQNGAFQSSTSLGGVGSNIRIIGSGDFEGIGRNSLLLSDSTTGGVSAWILQGGAFSQSRAIGGITADTSILAIGDVNGDNVSDVLLRDPNGIVIAWMLDSASQIQSVTTLGRIGSSIQVVGTADFTHDGNADLLLRDTASGAVSYWSLANGAFQGSTTLGGVGSAFDVVGGFDMTGDNIPDVLIRNRSTGDISYWRVNESGGFASSTQLGGVPASFEVVGARDVTGDGWNDVILRDTASGGISAWTTVNGQFQSSVSLGGVSADFLIY